MLSFYQKLAKIITVSQTFSLILAILVQSAFPSVATAADSTKLLAISQKTTTLAVATDGVDASVEITLPEVPQPDKEISGVLTAYSSTPGQTDDDPFTAASGKKVYDGMVANNCLPFGTKLKFPELYGDKEFTVDDRMNSRYGCNRFDIWLDAPIKVVNQFGVKRKTVQVFLKKKTVPVAKAKTIKAVEIADAK
jgi:hypothetical protein